MAKINFRSLDPADMINKYRNTGEWDDHKMVLLRVWGACGSEALPVERINRIGAALVGIENVDLQKALTKAVREGFLRSRKQGGQRLYEMNY